MPSEMFGGSIGTRAWEQDYRAAIGAGKTLGEIAMQPLESERIQQQTRLYGAQADKAVQEVEAERRMAALLASGVPTPQGGSVADQLDTLSQAALGEGLITKGTALAKDAALVRSREATTRSAAATQRLNQLKAIREQTVTVGQFFGDPRIKSEDDWQQAQARYAMQGGGAPFAGVPYSPQLVKGIARDALSTKEEIDSEEKRLTRGETQNYRRDLLDQRRRSNDIRGFLADVAERREKRLEKSGGGRGVSSPRDADIEQVKRLIKKDFPGFKDSAAELGEAAFAVASEARALMRSNSALNPAMAIQQAYSAAVQAGDLREVPRRFLGSIPRYVGRGKTAATALPIPDGAKPEDLEKDKYYITGRGRLRWTGKGFEVSGRMLSGGNGRPNEDEEDEDEED